MRHFERRFVVDARHRHRRVVVVFFERSFRRRVSAHRRRTFRVHELLRGHGGVPRARSSEQHGPHQLDRLVGVWHIHPRDGLRRHAVSRRPTRTDVPQHHPPAFGVSERAGDFERTERFASQTVTKRPLAEARHERRRGGGEEPPVLQERRLGVAPVDGGASGGDHRRAAGATKNAYGEERRRGFRREKRARGRGGVRHGRGGGAGQVRRTPYAR
mmetsp:Transcript_2535/g.9990  ORF Transcript_2535/g.9990 Transcript_2535/m.9990 type:complete len:215 (-) Transcript_2535:898-1542(-)